MSGSQDSRLLTIGEVATRTGCNTSALRFYEECDLITSERNEAGHRRYRNDVLRRVSFILTAQRVGLKLEEIGAALASLPNGRTPTANDWARLAKDWAPSLDERIQVLTRLRDQLNSCIGCGCLSLEACGIWNPDDAAAALGDGARYLLSDERPSAAGKPRPV
jgi:MerR family redox-sensitive transcriptional activator SoxR